jgi:DNA-binding response OmpR family regulator
MLKVMIAEDDQMIADVTEQVMTLAGYHVCGIARTVADAIDLGRHYKPDLAVLDLRLADGRMATEIVAELSALDGLGVLYSTGNISRVMLTVADGHACLRKPYSIRTLLRSLEIVTDIVARKTVSPPFPPGFRVLSSAPTLQLMDLK